jgi:hypothetical protein
MNFICDHQPDCSKPDRYYCPVEYWEIWSSNGLEEIYPDDSEPAEFVCSECDALATLEASETIKQNKKTKVEESKQERMI